MIVAENGVIVHVPGDENLKVPYRISKNPLDALKLLDVIFYEFNQTIDDSVVNALKLLKLNSEGLKES